MKVGSLVSWQIVVWPSEAGSWDRVEPVESDHHGLRRLMAEGFIFDEEDDFHYTNDGYLLWHRDGRVANVIWRIKK